MIDYQNQSLDIDELPKFETSKGHPIAKAYLSVLRIFYCLKSLVLFGILFLLNYYEKLPKFIVYISLFALLIYLVIYIVETEKGFPKRRFSVREQDIIFQRGFLFFKQTIVPFNRIQHVEVKQDLIFRIFDIYSLKLFTAGSSSGDLSLAGLNKSDADKLKAILLKGASADES